MLVFVGVREERDKVLRLESEGQLGRKVGGENSVGVRVATTLATK